MAEYSNTRVAGCGGCGSNFINILKERKANLRQAVIDTDARQDKNADSAEKIFIHGFEKGRKSAVRQEEQLRLLLEEYEQQIDAFISGATALLVAGALSGLTGRVAGSYMLERAKVQGLQTVSVVVTPYEYEGRERVRRSEKYFPVFRELSDILVVFHNTKLQLLTDVRSTFLGAMQLFGNAMADIILHASDDKGYIAWDTDFIRKIITSSPYAGIAEMYLKNETGV